jgi:TIR domain
MAKGQTESLECGDIVFVERGPHKGRIGYYDDDDTPRSLIVYFGEMLHTSGYYCIARSALRRATMNDLVTREGQLSTALAHHALHAKQLSHEEHVWTLLEYNLVSQELSGRHIRNRLSEAPARNIFLCHASADKWLVRRVFDDLTDLNHAVWLDEFQIQAGDSIVAKINQGLGSCVHVVVFLSKNSGGSQWVKREWHSSLSRSLSGATIKLVPVLIEDCEIPELLHDIKYADFRKSYLDGLQDLVAAFR